MSRAESTEYQYGFDISKQRSASTTPGKQTYRNTIAWFSALAPNLAQALAANSSAAAMALPSFVPFCPFAEEVYVLMETRAWEESWAVGRLTW